MDDEWCGLSWGELVAQQEREEMPEMRGPQTRTGANETYAIEETEL